MSTRATYTINDEQMRNEHTFFIHHDGYPEYAYKYFENAANSERNGFFADKFHAANDRSELTSCHADHQDTEFEYTLTIVDRLTNVMRVVSKQWDGSGRKVVFKGNMVEFLDFYKSKSQS